MTTVHSLQQNETDFIVHPPACYLNTKNGLKSV